MACATMPGLKDTFKRVEKPTIEWKMFATEITDQKIICRIQKELGKKSNHPSIEKQKSDFSMFRKTKYLKAKPICTH